MKIVTNLPDDDNTYNLPNIKDMETQKWDKELLDKELNTWKDWYKEHNDKDYNSANIWEEDKIKDTTTEDLMKTMEKKEKELKKKEAKLKKEQEILEEEKKKIEEEKEQIAKEKVELASIRKQLENTALNTPENKALMELAGIKTP